MKEEEEMQIEQQENQIKEENEGHNGVIKQENNIDSSLQL